MKYIAIIFFLTFIVSCKTASVDKTAEAPRSDGYKCEKTQTTGSHFRKKRCTTKKQRDDERELATDLMKNGQGPKTSSTGGVQ
jgi:hypothetical protein